MYKVETSKSNAFDAAESFENNNILKHLHGVYSVEVKEYTVEDGRVSSTGISMLYGDYCVDLNTAKTLSIHTARVAEILQNEVEASDNSSVIILTALEDTFSERIKKDIVSVINNMSIKEYIKELVPYNVDYVAVISSAGSKVLSDCFSKAFKRESSSAVIEHNIKIGYRTTDVLILRVS